MTKQTKKKFKLTAEIILDSVLALGFAFFIALVGVALADNFTGVKQTIFSLSLLCAICYILVHHLDRIGVYDAIGLDDEDVW
jgi:hypothetical protein